MKKWKVTFSDGDSSWNEMVEAMNEDHLVEILNDFYPYDIDDYQEVE